MLATTIIIALVGVLVLSAIVLAVLNIGRLEEDRPSDARGAKAHSDNDPLSHRESQRRQAVRESRRMEKVKEEQRAYRAEHRATV